MKPHTLHNEITSCCSLFQVEQVTVPVNFFYYEAQLLQMTKQSKTTHLGEPWQFTWQSKEDVGFVPPSSQREAFPSAPEKLRFHPE